MKFVDVCGNSLSFVNVYDIERCYGGPEEGGWWYDTGEPVLSIALDLDTDVDKLIQDLRETYPRTGNRYSVLGGEDYDIYVEDAPGEFFPQEIPFWE